MGPLQRHTRPHFAAPSLALALLIGCTSAIEFQAPTAVGLGQPIDGWAEYKFGMPFSKIKQTLGGRGYRITAVSKVNGLQDPSAVLDFLATHPASSEALLLPEDVATGTRVLWVFGYSIGGEKVPGSGLVLEFGFNRRGELRSVDLIFRPVSGIDLEDYAHTVIVPHLDEKYRRATGSAPGRLEKVLARWIDPGSENQILLFGVKGFLFLVYAGPGGAKAAPIF